MSFWDPVLDKLRKRLTKWKRKILSFGGRICLIRSVLSSIPLYYLSFFRMPAGVLAKCNSILRRFLWGGKDEVRKVCWVKWEKVCLPKKDGGLGVKDWNLFNLALLGKWRWRMIREHDNLWCRILLHKYKSTVKSSDSRWWKDLFSVCFGNNSGGWFDEALSRRVGDGRVFSFWGENWMGNGVFKELFPRLFLLSSQQEARICEMGEWRDGRWSWNFSWRRPLLQREQVRVDDLLRLISCFSPSLTVQDEWTWIKEGSGIYSVRSAYEFLQGDVAVNNEDDKLFLKLC